MYKEEIKKEVINIYNQYNTMTDCMVEVKVSVHTLEKLGVDVSTYKEIIDYLGTYLYKLKMKEIDMSEEL